jgi:dTDP-4-amino-4,6-dideoxygalactose transaminase
VHLFGWTSARLKEFRAFCEERQNPLLEDGAQSFGVKVDGRNVYSDAQISTLSFYPAKVLGASGDAGAIMCKDLKLAEKVRSLCNHGRAGHYTYDYVGWNSRLGALQARFLNAALKHVDEFIASRLDAMSYFYDKVGAANKDVRLYSPPKGVKGNGYLNVMHSSKVKGDAVVAYLQKQKVGAARTYPQTLDLQGPAKACPRVSDLTRSKVFSEGVVNLPLFPGITRRECEIATSAYLAAMDGKA